MNIIGNITAVVMGASGVYLFREYLKPGMCESKARMDGKTVIITGANSGIGKETARDLWKRGARVIMGCRNIDKAREAANDIQETKSDKLCGEIQIYPLDLANIKSIKNFALEIDKNENRIDILINNAGILGEDKLSRTNDGFELTMATNYLGPFLLTNLLLDKLKENSDGARIINVSARAHTRFILAGDILEDMNCEKRKYSGFQAYGESKLASVLFTKELARRLNETKVTTYALHPGLVESSLNRNLGKSFGWDGLAGWYRFALRPISKTCFQGAQTSIYCAIDEDIKEESGEYYSDCKKIKSHPLTYNKDFAKKFWDVSEKLVNSK